MVLYWFILRSDLFIERATTGKAFKTLRRLQITTLDTEWCLWYVASFLCLITTGQPQEGDSWVLAAKMSPYGTSLPVGVFLSFLNDLKTSIMIKDMCSAIVGMFSVEKHLDPIIVWITYFTVICYNICWNKTKTASLNRHFLRIKMVEKNIYPLEPSSGNTASVGSTDKIPIISTISFSFKESLSS